MGLANTGCELGKKLHVFKDFLLFILVGVRGGEAEEWQRKKKNVDESFLLTPFIAATPRSLTAIMGLLRLIKEPISLPIFHITPMAPQLQVRNFGTLEIFIHHVQDIRDIQDGLSFHFSGLHEGII